MPTEADTCRKFRIEVGLPARLGRRASSLSNYNRIPRYSIAEQRTITDGVLFLVDRGNLGDQTLKDWSSSDKTLSEGKARRVSAGSANQFQQFVTPDDGRKLAA